MVIASDTIQISVNTAHHVLFWDKNNTYMGYGNIASHYEGVAFLGDYVDDVVFPTGASKFALQVNKKGVNAQSYPDVSGHTYAELFADPSYLTFTDSVLSNTLGTVMSSPTYLNYTDSVITGNLNLLWSNPLWLNYQTEYGDTLAEIFTPALVTINNIGYSKTDLDNESANFGNENITVLSLTNLIQNGQMVNETAWSGMNIRVSISNGLLHFTNDSIDSYTTQTIQTTGQTYYYSFTISNYISGNVYVNGNASILHNSNGLFSRIYVAIASYFIIDDLSNLAVLDVDDVSLFASGSYTKTQIDTALSYSGYLPYNTAYSIPDFTDADAVWGTNLSYSEELAPQYYVMMGSGIGTSLEIYDFSLMDSQGIIGQLNISTDLIGDYWNEWRSVYGDKLTTYKDSIDGLNPYLFPATVKTAFYNPANETDRDYYVDLYWDAVEQTPDNWEWYSDKGITAGNQAYYLQLYADANSSTDRWEWYRDSGVTSGNYAYYTQLYADATANTERYEWYTQNGINQFNYAYNRAMFDNLTAWYGNGLSLVQLQNIDITYQREEVIPPVQLTMLEKLESYIDDLGVGQFGYVLISLVIMVLVGIGLALLHAPAVVLLIIEASFFLMFSVFGWFPLWIVILMAILLFIIIYITIKGGGSNG
jgi:hypothetical protein